MPAVQSLKKQLRGIRSTQKLTKAMKTSSTIKFSKLNDLYSRYSEYGEQCRMMLERYGAEFVGAYRESDTNAPAVAIVLGSEKGMCGSFNAELFHYAQEKCAQMGEHLLVVCGQEAAHSWKDAEKVVSLGEIPSYEGAAALLEEILAWRREGRASRIFVIYPKYVNMMLQIPSICELFTADSGGNDDRALLIPDRRTVVEKTAGTVFQAMFYKLVLESAIGAQAATVMAMRSAYDTATEFRFQMEGQINRIRQSIVTADILETSAKAE